MTRLYSVDPVKPSSTVHFDWLTAVFPVSGSVVANHSVKSYIDSVLNRLHLDSYMWDEMEHGVYTYKRAFDTADGTLIIGFSDDSPDFMIQASGAGVESIESTYLSQGLPIAEYVKLVSGLKGTFSRVDACSNFFNYPLQYSAWFAGMEAKKGNLITSSRRCRLVNGFPSTGAGDDEKEAQTVKGAWTFYVGRNPLQLRVYNKLAERSDKVNILYDVRSWSRWEFQLNGDQAQAFIDGYIKRDYNLPQTWVDWLVGHYRFIERVGHQSKRSRYPTATWFSNLIKTARSELKLRKEKQLPTFERKVNWLNKQVYKTLGELYYTRYLKYKQNGVSDADARKLALKKLQSDIDDQIVNGNIDMGVVSAWLSEHGIRILL